MTGGTLRVPNQSTWDTKRRFNRRRTECFGRGRFRFGLGRSVDVGGHDYHGWLDGNDRDSVLHVEFHEIARRRMEIELYGKYGFFGYGRGSTTVQFDAFSHFHSRKTPILPGECRRFRLQPG